MPKIFSNLSKDTRQFSQGVDHDSATQFIGSSDQGVGIDANNMRHTDADKDSVTKIGGERLLYDALMNACTIPLDPLGIPYGNPPSTMVNIGSLDFFLEDDKTTHNIEFWADSLSVYPSYIRIDGIIVLLSVDFPFTWNHPLQIAKNENCIGGEIYPTDYNVQPMIFNVKDLMVNGGFTFDGVTLCTTKYFGAFNVNDYYVELASDNNHPIFIQISRNVPLGAETIGALGMKPGLYQYQTRKVTTDGDATAWSKATPMIPMVMNYTYLDRGYPYMKTYGGTTADTSAFGIHIRFRVENTGGYDYLEIKRTRFSDESAIGAGGVEKLLDYRLDLNDGDFFIKDIFDIGALELDLPDESIISGFASLRRAKAVRYYNSRLVYMNIEFQNRDVSSLVTIGEANGKRMFPVIQKITTPVNQSGHKDPYNYAYYRTLMRGEKYGWALDFRDGNNQLSFALPMPASSSGEEYTDYQMPNRRDICATETIQNSNGTVTAANVDGTNITPENPTGIAVQQTHEVFDTVDSYVKNDGFSLNTFYLDINGNNVINYSPFTPTGQANPYGGGDTRGWNLHVNTRVGLGADITPDMVPYNPKAFGLNYYALGMAVQSVNNIPSYIKSFSIVRTKPATRVVAQGLGFYSLRSYGNTSNRKDLSEIIFYSPDMDNSTSIDPQIIDDIKQSIASAGANSKYKVQLVSPLGFFTEVYSGHEDGLTNLRWQGIDMACYARILREDGTINPTDLPDAAPNGMNGVGISSSPADGYGYTGYGKWRSRNNPGIPFANAGNGNQLFDITNFITEQGQGTLSERYPQIKITLSPSLYNADQIPDQPPPPSNFYSDRKFNGIGTQNWHEPMYVINIIDTLASVPQSNIQTYLETEHYQKTEALVGTIVGGLTREEFIVVDERPEDYANAIFVEAADGTRTVYMNVTAIQGNIVALGAVVAAIQLGTQTVNFAGVVRIVTGIFIVASTTITDSYSEHRIVFDTALNIFGVANPIPIFMPNLADKIYVLYDSAIPIKAFGGEASIHESVFSPIDLSAKSDGSMQYTNFDFSYPFPFLHYELPANYRRPGDITLTWGSSSETFNRVDFLLYTGIQHRYSRLRQIIAMFSCESRISLPYAFEDGYDGSLNHNTFFPATHYIIRPWAWNPNLDPDFQQSYFHGAYMQSYPNEKDIWGNGGFRFRPQTNIDYSKQDEDHTVTSPPKVGANERTLFCTGIIWSLERPENVVDAPGLRTFPATNFFVISDDTGDIKYAYDELTEGKGNNLWAITDGGVCLLITDKTLLYGKTGDELATIGSTGGSTWVQGQLWISKSIGMNDEFWRSAAEGYNVIKGDLSQRRVEALFFSNKMSQYRLSQGAIFDIAKGGKYHSRVYPTYLKLAGKEYLSPMSAIYDKLNDEYWSCFFHVNGKYTVVFDEKKERYMGTFDYRFDKFTSFDGNTYGMRNAQTYILDQYGENINSQPIESILVGVSAKSADVSKNFSRIDIAPPGIKPTKILFYGTKEDYLSNIDRAEIDTVLLPLSLKNYGFWSGFIPRKVAGNRDRVQGQQVLFVVKSLGNDRFKINTVAIGYTALK